MYVGEGTLVSIGATVMLLLHPDWGGLPSHIALVLIWTVLNCGVILATSRDVRGRMTPWLAMGV